MLHFIFYGYIQKKFPDSLGKLDTESGLLWDMAEIFNATVQSTDDFIVLHGVYDFNYPDHQNLLTDSKKIWQDKCEIDDWINKMTQLLKINK